MRAAAAAFALLAALSARADVSIDATQPHTPLGAACDRALAEAQAHFSDRAPDIHFHVRERRVVGEYHWSDMCGVWGDYSVVLAPDLRPAQPWRWSDRSDPAAHSIHRRGVARGHGIRATFILDADETSSLGDWFVEAFQPALDVCLATAFPSR